MLGRSGGRSPSKEKGRSHGWPLNQPGTRALHCRELDSTGYVRDVCHVLMALSVGVLIMQKPRYFKSSLAVCVATGLLVATSALTDEEHPKHGSHSAMMVKMMDANQDGKITGEEHEAGAKKMFERMDANNDGQVSETEMSDHHREMMNKHHGKRMTEMSSAEKIRTIDTNEDGLLTAQEHAVASKHMFGKMDKDQDGILTTAEIDAGHKKMMSSSGALDH